MAHDTNMHTTDRSTQAADPHASANIVPNTARSLVALLQDRGMSAERLCRGLGFTPDDLARQDLMLSHQQTRTMILRAQRLLSDPALGLASGARQSVVSWGLPGLAMLTCETFGEAISYGLQHQGHAGAMLEHRFQVDEREAHLEVAPLLFDVAIEHFLVEESFAGALAVARRLLGPSFRLLRLDLAYTRPKHEEAYRRMFRCPLRFEAASHRLSFESFWLDTRMPGYDRATCGLVREQLNRLLRRPLERHQVVESLTTRLRAEIEQAPSQVLMAREVNVSDRTLRRRLRAHDTSFRSLRDSTRYERARDLLAHTAMTIAEVAETVGYSDARAFRRAFKRWSGQLPAAYRQGIGATSGDGSQLPAPFRPHT